MNFIFTKKLSLGLVLILSSLFSFGQYCMPTSNCIYGDGITSFGVGSFTNASSCEADNGIDGYADFTALTGLDLGQGTPYVVNLLSGFGSQQVSIWIDQNNDMSFDSTELILTNQPVGTDLVAANITIPMIPLGVYRLRVKAVYNGPSDEDACADATFGETEDYTLNVVTPPSCIAVSNLEAGSITSSSAMISWTENGTASAWDIEVVEAGVTPNGTPTMGFDDITNPMMVTNLSPLTGYDIYVRADCGMDNTSDLSSWSGPLSFTTECTTYIPDYNESFSMITNQVPQCWSMADAGNPTTGPSMFGESSWFEDGFANDGSGGALRINLYQGDVQNDWLISPTFDLSSGGPYQVDFNFSITAFSTSDSTNLGSDDRVEFLISTDAGTTWTSLQSWDAQSNVNPLGEAIIIDLAAYTGNVIFALWASDGMVDDPEDNDIFIDDFFVRTPPSCIEPSGLTVGNVGANTAMVSWTENGTATIGDIEFGEIGFTPTGMATTGYDNVENPTMLMGLTAVTTYDVYVRADCSIDNSDVSTWIGPITFTTLCDSYTAPYSENFDIDPATCWTEGTGGTPQTGPDDIGLSSWNSTPFANDGTATQAQRINLYTLSDNDWLISPTIALTGGTFNLEFDFSITDYNTSDSASLGSDDQVRLLISTDGMATWTTLNAWDAASIVNPLGENIVNNLAAYNGMNVTFAFWATEGTVDDPEDIDIFVDNFSVTTATPAILGATAGVSSVTCNGMADGAIDLNVTGGVMPFTFAWSNGSTDEDLDNLNAGTYTVTVTDANSMTTEITEEVTEPMALVSDAIAADETLDGASDGSIDLTITGGTAGYTFAWDNGATTEDLDSLADGTYCVTITDANGCTQTTCADVMAGPVSIQNISDLTNFKVYPNPVGNENFLIDLTFSFAKDLDIQVINAFGKEVYQSKHLNVADLKTEVNATRLPAGIYFVKITALEENQIMTYRLIKK